MRTRGVLVVLAICAASTGCSGYFRSIERNFAILPLQAGDEQRMKFRNHHRAEEAWRLLSEGSHHSFSEDFGDGFVAGYADYLNYGGHGEPPAVPPFRYRTVKYQTPDGVEAINQWYEGWRHGAVMADPAELATLAGAIAAEIPA